MLTTLVVLLAAVQGSDNPVAFEPPTDREVLRALPRATRGLPFVFEAYRDDIVIVKNLLVTKTVTLPVARWPITVTVAHWECAAYYTETIESAYPFPFKAAKKRVQVVYIDRAGVVK